MTWLVRGLEDSRKPETSRKLEDDGDRKSKNEKPFEVSYDFGLCSNEPSSNPADCFDIRKGAILIY